MMIKCEITGKEYDEKYMTKTTDGFWINFDTYKFIAMDEKKGALTLNECLLSYYRNECFNKLVTEYLLKIRGEVPPHIDRNVTDEINRCKANLKEYIQIENYYAETYMNKNIGCMNKKDLIDLLVFMIPNIEWESCPREHADGKEADAVFSEYRKYHTGIQFYF